MHLIATVWLPFALPDFMCFPPDEFFFLNLCCWIWKRRAIKEIITLRCFMYRGFDGTGAMPFHDQLSGMTVNIPYRQHFVSVGHSGF